MESKILIDMTGSMFGEIPKIETFLLKLKDDLGVDSKTFTVSVYSEIRNNSIIQQFKLNEFNAFSQSNSFGSGDSSLSRTISKQLINTEEYFIFISDFYLSLDSENFLYHQKKRNIKNFFVSTSDLDFQKHLNFKESANYKAIKIEDFSSLKAIFKETSLEKKLTM